MNGCRQKQLIKYQNNNQDSSPLIHILWSEQLSVYLTDKSISKVFLTSNESSMDQIDFFSKKVISSKSGENYAQIKHCLQVTKVRNTSKHILVNFYVRGQQGIDLITGGSVIMDYGFVFWLEVTSSDSFNVKKALMMDLLITNRQLFALQDVHWWTRVVWITRGELWCFYQLFGLSFWRHLFTAEDPMVSK